VHTLGKGEVVSSILTSSTSETAWCSGNTGACGALVAGSIPAVATNSLWPSRLVARIPPFHGEEAGSKPVWATSFEERGQAGNAAPC